MIITRFQNYIQQNTNRSVTNKNTLPISFTSKIQLNSDVFVPHDKHNATQQYINTYEPGTKSEFIYINYDEYKTAIEELNSDKSLDSEWLKKHSKLLKKVFGLEISDKSEANKLCLSDINLNRNKLGASILTSLESNLDKYYETCLLTAEKTQKYEVKNFDLNALKKYNISMAILDYDKTIPEDLSLFYRTTKPLPNVKQLGKYTKANILDARNNIKANSFTEDIHKQIETAKELYKTTGRRSIILLNDMYKYTQCAEGNEFFCKAADDFKNNYCAIFVTEDILPSVKPKNNTNQLKFSDIPVYHTEQQRFIKDIIEPLKNNDVNAPQIIVMNSKTSPKDTFEFLYAGLNEIESDVKIISKETNINDFANIITNIKADSAKNKKSVTTFIIIPQAYKYIAGKPENIQLLKSLQNSEGHKIVPVLYSSYTKKLLEKMQIQNTSKQFTLKALNENELEQILRLYTDKADDYINDLITSGKDIQPINTDLDYKQLAGILNSGSNNGFSDIKNIVDKAKNSYLSSQKHTFNDYIFNLIIGGLNNEN